MNEIEVSYKNKAEELAAWAISLQVCDDMTRQSAVETYLKASIVEKVIEGYHKAKIERAKARYDKLNGEKNKLVSPFIEIRKILAKKIGDDYITRETITAEKQEALRKLNTNNEEWSPDIVLAQAQRTITVDCGSVNVRPKKKIKITDKKALIQSVARSDWPLDFLTINIPYIEREVSECNWSNIPGITIGTGTVVTGREK